MEIMEEGNLVDRVRILLQKDMQYYQEQQTVLRESMCGRVTGGKFDFPKHASFAAVKMVTWWEAEFIQAFLCTSGFSPIKDEDAITDEDDGVVKKTKPSEFILLVVETSEMLMAHLHKLIQESLDHADLTVLTAVLGAAALIRNSLLCYDDRAKGKIPRSASEKVHKCYKNFDELVEAVAHRLLDLHCRLILLYVIMEADSVNWEDDQPFFEKQRSTFIIQMWWLYMNGMKTDLWNTVPPKMAQRVFSGVLDESLSVLVYRAVHGKPSLARSMQFWCDAMNVLRCTAHLALSVCVSGNEMIGEKLRTLSIPARDIYHKCYQLLICLLLRGAPLRVLYQVFRKGMENLTISKPQEVPAAWVYVSAPHLIGTSHAKSKYGPLDQAQAAILELNVLKSQPQPNWTQLVKVLVMNDYALTRILLGILVRQCAGNDPVDPGRQSRASGSTEAEDEPCGRFLCAGGSCRRTLRITPAMGLHALVHTITCTNYEPAKVLVPELKNDPNWSNYVDRTQVWNQVRPAWLDAILILMEPPMTPIVETILDARKKGASIYQTMSVALNCFSELFVCMPLGILRTALAMDEKIPAHCHPLGGSVVLQLLCSALYSALLSVSTIEESNNTPQPGTSKTVKIQDPNDAGSIALTLTEAVCSIDEENKHTDQIEELLNEIRATIGEQAEFFNENFAEENTIVIEHHLGELADTEAGRTSLDVLYEYIMRTSKHLLELLKPGGKKIPDSQISALNPLHDPPLTYTMFHIGDEPFDQLIFDYNGFPWEMIFEIPLGIKLKRVVEEVLLRPEILNVLQLENQEERETANLIKKLCQGVEFSKEDFLIANEDDSDDDDDEEVKIEDLNFDKLDF